MYATTPSRNVKFECTPDTSPQWLPPMMGGGFGGQAGNCICWFVKSLAPNALPQFSGPRCIWSWVPCFSIQTVAHLILPCEEFPLCSPSISHQPGAVAHAYNPTYSESRVQEVQGLKPALENCSGDSISKKLIIRQGWWNCSRGRVPA
jgi:hypothetical protein